MEIAELMGIVLSIVVIYYNSQIIRFGVKNIDLTEHLYLMHKVAIPASLTELAYFIWAFKFLPSRVIFLLFIGALTALLFKMKKVNGYKFAIYVLAPVTESMVILYGLFTVVG